MAQVAWAKLSTELPAEGTGFVYEPKWDGFRAQETPAYELQKIFGGA